MDRMKTFLKYALWIIGFFILSELLINVGLNSNYKDLKRQDEISQINIYQAQATKINGRIKGVISDTEEYSGKYICVNLYSARQVFLGKQYIAIDELQGNNTTKPFELYFKLQDVAVYDVKIVDEKDPEGSLFDLIPKDLTRPEIIAGTILAFLIFW